MTLAQTCQHPEAARVHLEIIDPLSFGSGGMFYDWCGECGALLEENDETVHISKLGDA